MSKERTEIGQDLGLKKCSAADCPGTEASGDEGSELILFAVLTCSMANLA